MRQIPRLFVEAPLADGLEVTPDRAQLHYLSHVLRVADGDEVRLLDDRTGEWRATVRKSGKRDLRLRVGENLRPREVPADLWLLTAPIRRERFQWIVEKATELGVARILPIRTERTDRAQLNMEKLRAHMVEAAEQCERTALPELAPLAPLADVLAGWPRGRQLIFCDEEGGVPMADVATAWPAAILIGPAGGFAAGERQAILTGAAGPDVVRASLGPNILRADTAVVAAIAQFQVIAAHQMKR